MIIRLKYINSISFKRKTGNQYKIVVYATKLYELFGFMRIKFAFILYLVPVKKFL